MGLGHSPRIITDGLVLALDAANPKNYNLTAVEVLVVAGGGGGGAGTAGGGGAGGVIYNSNFAVTPGSALTVTVGAGGTGKVYAVSNSAGDNGGNSVFGSLTAIGGGGGGNRDTNEVGKNGGSGGGGGGAEGGVNGAGTGTSGQGFAGGTGRGGGGGSAGGGGGGAGGVGQASPSSGLGGNGGPGLGFNISGTFTYYGGGGGGGSHTGRSSGGIGGGGAGSENGPTYNAVAGTTNTGGGGGGGGGAAGGQFGGNGGSGIVIVRYPGPQKAIGGTITSNNGYTIHTFTTVGSTTFTPLVATNNSAILGLSDFSGRGNFGTTVNSPTYSSSGGGSIVFDGTNDRVECAHNSTLNITSSITMESWIYPTAYKTTGGGGGMIITKLSYYMELAGSGVVRLYFYGLSSEGYHNGTVNVPLNTWSHIVGVRDQINNLLRIYVNGSLDREISSITGNISSNTTAVTIGSYSGSSYEYTGRIANTKIYNRALSAAEIQQNYNALKGRYTLDGSTSDRAAPSASYLVSLGITADGIYWINLPTAGPTQIYCILNPAYDGGGWMMAMKATRGTTFNYSANYWTTANTLNPTQTNRNDGDAKFNSMNYFQAKDMMAVWPDISNGGSIPGSTLGWTWLENNFNDGTRITPISFFGITYPTMNTGGSGKFIKDAKTFSGWASGVFSSQVDIRFYGFNYTNNPSYGVSAKCRWGFGWNENGEGLYPSSGGGAPGSNDVSGGIGMDTSFGSYSAGDVIVCCQDTIGINRSARVEVYVR